MIPMASRAPLREMGNPNHAALLQSLREGAVLTLSLERHVPLALLSHHSATHGRTKGLENAGKFPKGHAVDSHVNRVPFFMVN